MKNHISTFNNLMLKYLVFAFFVGFGVLFSGCNPKNVIEPDSEYVAIPDMNFEKALIRLKIDDVQDGRVLKVNILKVGSLIIVGNSQKPADQIKSISGIEAFVNLSALNCSENSINNLDLSKNKSLIELDCSSNLLKQLDISMNVKLGYLKCDQNQLTVINFGKITNLTTIYCESNRLLNIDFSTNTQLETLFCTENQLTSLDVSKNISLISLLCSQNKIQTICVNNLNQVKPYWEKDPTTTYKVCP